MDSNISELVKLGHERADELKASCGAIDVRSVAQLISDLSSQLEVQYVRAEESRREFRSADITVQNLEAQLKQSKIDSDCYKKGMEASNTRLVQLAAENAGLKAGIGFFSYDSSGCYEEHDSAEKAAAYAEDSISEYRDNAPDGWSDEVGSVVWGVIMQRATMTGLRPVTEDDSVAPGIEEWCDYTLLPNIETPATDAFLAEVRASAIKCALDDCDEYLDRDCIMESNGISYDDAALREIGAMTLREALLRKGDAQ